MYYFFGKHLLEYKLWRQHINTVSVKINRLVKESDVMTSKPTEKEYTIPIDVILHVALALHNSSFKYVNVTVSVNGEPQWAAIVDRYTGYEIKVYDLYSN